MTGLYRTHEVPRSTEDLHAFCEAGRSEHFRNYDYLNTMIPVLRSYLQRSVPAGTITGLIIARQVVRPLRHAVDLNWEAAQAMLRAWHVYQAKVLNVQDTGQAPFKI